MVKNGSDIVISFTGRDNLFNAIYSNCDIRYSNLTYWGSRGIEHTGPFPMARSEYEAGQNVSVFLLVNGVVVIDSNRVTDNNGRIVLESVEGDYFVLARHKEDSYYTYTECMITNMQFYVNVTSMTSKSGAVNITAESNTRNDVVGGILVFILPNGTSVIANYSGEGKWWSTYLFDNPGEYNVSASYWGLDDVTINNGIIVITKDVPIKVNDMTISYGETAEVVVEVPEAINGQKITISVNESSKNVTVEKGIAKALFTGLAAGEYCITAEYSADSNYSANSTTARLTVEKAISTLSVWDLTLVYGTSIKITPKAEGAVDLIAKIDGNELEVDDFSIEIPILAIGNHTLELTTITDENHISVTKTANINICEVDAKISPKLEVMVGENDLIPGDTAYISIRLTDPFTGEAIDANVLVEVNGRYYYETLIDGEDYMAIPDLPGGTYPITVRFDGNY